MCTVLMHYWLPPKETLKKSNKVNELINMAIGIMEMVVFVFVMLNVEYRNEITDEFKSGET